MVLFHLRFPRVGSVDARAVATGLSDDSTELYATHFSERDPLLPWVQSLRPGSVVSLHELVRPAELEASAFYREWMRPFNLLPNGVTAALILKDDDAILSLLRVFRRWGGADFRAQSLQVLQELTPHLQRALVVNEELARTEKTRIAAATALERMPIAMITVNARLRVVATNEAARRILSDADGLSLHHDGVRARLRADDQVLREALQQAVFGGRRAVLRLNRHSSRRALLVKVEPADNALHMATLYLSDPDRNAPILLQDLQQLFRLTVMEARMVLALIDGQRVDEAAARMRVTIQTARSYLKQIFAKTGTSRQSELVRLIMSSPLPMP